MPFINRSIAIALLLVSGSAAVAAETPDFNRDVLPLFRKHCNSCHSAADPNGGIVLEDYARMLKGGQTGAAIAVGQPADASRLYRLASGLEEPKMPPEGAGFNAEELLVLKAWLDAGAQPPAGGLAAQGLVTPTIRMQAEVKLPITAIAVSPKGDWTAVARTTGVEITKAGASEPTILSGHAGSVNELALSADGSLLVVVSGETGLTGEATIWKTSDWSRGPTLMGAHRDSLYAAAVSDDNRWIATAGYDRQIVIWDAVSGEVIKTLTGHNDAVHSVAFQPKGSILASASGDRTVKIWDVASGTRLDTFSQPAKEQYVVAFDPAGKRVLSGGVDNRLRVWSLSATAVEGTNPLDLTRFAHEGPLLKVVFHPTGRLLATTAEDRRVKIWETGQFTEVALLERQADWPTAIAFSADGERLLIGQMNGELQTVTVNPAWFEVQQRATPLDGTVAGNHLAATPAGETIAEQEPNEGVAAAKVIKVGETATGVLGTAGDEDWYAFDAAIDQPVVFETNASRSGSAADTRISIVDEQGQPVLRAKLQAVRDSWITFRPVNSTELEVRLEYWSEMDLNQFLYIGGEVMKLHRAPRGPDSGYFMYPGFGSRHNYFDTSGSAHAKEEPAYIVEAYLPETPLIDNGLPIFPVYFMNDDDSERELGADSRLTFSAPATGRYFIKVQDARGFGGEKFSYQLSLRNLKPDFSAWPHQRELKIPAGSGQRFMFGIDRKDGFSGPVELSVTGLPAGWFSSLPVVIEAGQYEARTSFWVNGDAKTLTPEEVAAIKFTAKATIGEHVVAHDLGGLTLASVEAAPQVKITLSADADSRVSADGAIQIRPGESTTAMLRIERNGYDGDVQVELEGLPYGVIVDNIGLNGVLIRAGETERQIFLNARRWVGESVRPIHAVTQGQGAQSSAAVLLQVVSPEGVNTAQSQ